MNNIQRLLWVAGKSICADVALPSMPEFATCGSLGKELLGLLYAKNGFYAFESALHLFPAAHYGGEMTLGRWNSFGLWRHDYGALAENKVFFAEDACGNQFCISEGQIGFFDAETGDVEILADTLEAWAARILADYKLLTSFPLLHDWQIHHGALPTGQRLMLKTPLALGGNYARENVFAADAIEGMRLRGHIAKQIHDLPEGARVEFRVTED